MLPLLVTVTNNKYCIFRLLCIPLKRTLQFATGNCHLTGSRSTWEPGTLGSRILILIRCWYYMWMKRSSKCSVWICFVNHVFLKFSHWLKVEKRIYVLLLAFSRCSDAWGCCLHLSLQWCEKIWFQLCTELTVQHNSYLNLPERMTFAISADNLAGPFRLLSCFKA